MDDIKKMVENAKEEWRSPITGVTYVYRRLSKADLLDCPEALPIFDMATAIIMSGKKPTTDLEKEQAKRAQERVDSTLDKLAENEDKIIRTLLSRAVMRPKILPDPDDYDQNPPPDSVFYYMIPELDRGHLVRLIQRLMSGMDAIDRMVAANKAAEFREESDGAPDAPNDSATTESVGVAGDRE